MNKFWAKGIFVVVISSIIFSNTFIFTHGEQSQSTPRILVIGQFDDEQGFVNQRKVDLLVSHFSTEILFRDVTEVTTDDFKQRTHVIYYGDREAAIPDKLKQQLSTFTGVILAIGENVEKLGEHFSFIKQKSKGKVNQVFLTNDEANVFSLNIEEIITIETNEQVKALLVGKDDVNNDYPLFIQKDNHFYLATTSLAMPLSTFIAEVLHEVFSVAHAHAYQGYIRLEDVHPLVEADKLMAIAELLKERGIPYMVAVIPVYIHPKTKEKHYLSDSEDLLETLKFVQNNGGSIVMHGYTHQFRDSETGEGFEFWDVEHNMPIYHRANEQPVKQTRADFSSEADYQSYLSEKKQIESNYIENKLTKGIHELANYGLYPLAFEAPHYTMSQNGYQITSTFFSTYVGQLQLSDQNWQIMMEAPYETKPSFLHGMTLLPETIGYIENSSYALEKMDKAIKRQMVLRDGMIAGFYHPYLGVERFETMLELLEEIPNITWIDLKALDQQTKTDHVVIKSADGEIESSIAHLKLFQTDHRLLSYHINKTANITLWVFVGLGFFTIFLFLYYMLLIKHERKNGFKVRRGD
ncbi:polysaccharide deacetylase family protein [Paraliobacillus salinarum]|uniref:polysaccharide deacetylase family protein n=1 Tax=Paraliobacillus salinarum TaxID=1158996 RepID=UPI0015F661CB|nr:polysaccharide deacetylase family protein [Paraliobacillus salinarum]